MSISISREALDAILTRAKAAPDREICGLLLGQGDRVLDAVETQNVADDPARRFEIDPAALIAAYRAARAGGPAVLGHYHSHPGGDVRPSSCDAELATSDGALWLICSPDGASALWRAGADGLHGRFTPIDLLCAKE